jgi:hypothetical protein
MLLFIFTLGAGLVGQLSLGAAATVLAPAQYAFGSGASAASAAPATAAPATMAPVVAAPAPMLPATAAPATLVPTNAAPSGSGPSNTLPANQTMLPTPTEQASIMSVEQATPPAVARVFQSPSVPKALHKPANPWLFIWPGLAVLLGVLAGLAFWLNKRAFQRKNPRG